MRGRPRKKVDTKRILELREKGLSTREIAQELSTSHSTIWRVLKRCIKNVSKPLLTSKKPIQNPIQNQTVSKLYQNSTDVKVENHVNPARTSERMLTRTPPPPTTAPLGQAHHLLFALSYKGKQPISVRQSRYGKNNTNLLSLFDYSEFVIEAHKNRIKVWCNSITGNSTKEMQDKAYGRARALLGRFAAERDLELDWDSVQKLGHMHITFTSEHKDIDIGVLDILKQEPGRARTELGMLAGDSSHPNQTEFIGELGEASFDSFSWLIREFPKDWMAEREIVKEFSENFKSHFLMIQELRDTMKEMKTYIKELRNNKED